MLTKAVHDEKTNVQTATERVTTARRQVVTQTLASDKSKSAKTEVLEEVHCNVNTIPKFNDTRVRS